MTIEVYKETFMKVFNDSQSNTHLRRVSKKETYEKHFFFNEDLNQRGFKVWNYASSKKWQYYLTDINL